MDLLKITVKRRIYLDHGVVEVELTGRAATTDWRDTMYTEIAERMDFAVKSEIEKVEAATRRDGENPPAAAEKPPVPLSEDIPF